MSEQVIIRGQINFGPDDTNPLQNVVCGSHIQEFIEYQKNESGIDAEGAMNLRNSSCDILNYCNPHDAISNVPTTHLVVGYVQSGKTMSFTSLIELALDNHYRIVIVFAGITTNLLSQTDDRLGDDLVCGNKKNYKYFKIHKNPNPDKVNEICRNLKLKDSMVIINVLKHPSRINNVAKIFEDPLIQSALKNETALIIDDEADQASLNNYGRVNSKTNDEEEMKMSSTYEAILGLRNLLPGNSYVQYTATPQANILINTLDMLSPKTHTLLTPGKGYCGGKLFFGVGKEGERFGKSLIKIIPSDEVFNAKVNPLESIPQSLIQALMLHIWAVIINTRYYENVSQLSMMVHTDVTLSWNSTFYSWINNALKEWSDIFDGEGYGVKKYKLESEFQETFQEASSLYKDDKKLTFESLKKYIPEVLNDTKVYLITGDTNDMEELDWDQYTSNILVGAQMLNRGFTVKNLTTTYMPRYTTGTTNADTIEQRCRFFGYKEKYIRSCRVFLPQISIDNYIHYIESEEELRSIMSETKSMQECGHKILSYPKLNPTRKNILPVTVVRSSLSGMKDFSPYNNMSMMSYNLLVVDSLIKEYSASFKPFSRQDYVYTNYDANSFRRHISFRTPIDIAISFLKKLQLGNSNDIILRGNTIRYLNYLKESNTIHDIEIINMSEGKFKTRSLDESTKKMTSNLFNGPSTAGEGNYYLGDKAMYVDDTITIQLHHITFDNQDGLKTATISIYYPQHLSTVYIANS
jgi:hypothetical protein